MSARTSGLEVRLAASRSKFRRAKQVRRHVPTQHGGAGQEGRLNWRVVYCLHPQRLDLIVAPMVGGHWPSCCSHIPGRGPPEGRGTVALWPATTRDRRVASPSVSSSVSVGRHPLCHEHFKGPGPQLKVQRSCEKTAAGAHHSHWNLDQVSTVVLNLAMEQEERDGTRLKGALLLLPEALISSNYPNTA